MNRKTLFALLAAGLAFAGCGREAAEGPAEGSGQLAIDFSVTPDVNVVSTRANVPGVTAPDIEDFSLRIYAKGGNPDTGLFYPVITDYPSAMWHGVGNYVAVALCGDINEEGFDKPAFGVTKEFTIEAGMSKTETLEARLINTAVTVECTEAFRNYFSDYGVSLEKNDTEIVEFTKALFSTDSDSYVAFVKPEAFKLNLSYTRRSNGVADEKEVTVLSVNPCTHYKVRFDVNGGAVGGATLVITWDDTVEPVVEPIEIEVGEE